MFKIPEYRSITFGETSKNVRMAQGAVSLLGQGIVVDGNYGPATQQGFDAFRAFYGLPVGARSLSQIDWLYLMRKLYCAENRNPDELLTDDSPDRLRELLCWMAWQFLDKNPREVNSNEGPWVAMFNNGDDGIAWCAAFVTSLSVAAAEALLIAPPMPFGTYCPTLASIAKTSNRYTEDPSRVKRGDWMFFKPEAGVGYKHIGIVVSTPDLNSMTCLTIEGNTNEAGSYEGVIVGRKVRGLQNKAFCLMGV